ncbi:MAG TPA: hypothetical protein DCO83_06810 [Mucilaginibacter sp.]|jgi:hypothetical protein|nr:hypothetical protein [Mucilaginibacter sp.]
MNIAKERKAIDAALNNYRAQLDTISDEQFAETPPGGGWSYAEVYSHILQATLASSISLERCALGNCPPTKSGLNFLGKVLMILGRFPPALKLKVPPALAAKMPVTKISKEDAKNLLIKCRRRMDDMMPLIKQSSPISRYKHTRLGMLNAAQWYKFIRIHLEHHLKQMNRIKKN